MLDNYLLEELATFAATGTLAETAAKLNVTQPTVTRGMQKLEDDLGVQLFIRQPNRITLTATGELAAKEAQQLITANHAAVERIRHFDQSQRSLRLAATIPGPLIFLNTLTEKLPTTVTLEHNLLPTAAPELILNNDYDLVFTTSPLKNPAITTQLIGVEKLAVALNRFMIQANQPTVSFDDLAGLSFVVASDIGIWRDIIQDRIPHAKFFYQEQRAALTEITKYSDFPYFTSNLGGTDGQLPVPASDDDNRVLRPISDTSAQQPIYAAYLRVNASRVRPILTTLKAHWPAE
ncbi:LysR family transcriptional regulator [Levilactobacillus humaensis]|uniref:LysR family transcriptional regulator n=1 Tax=Levilactobacillus humaensis TaxID=2950375 RepID=UPI0021C32994|nr:LysR family transcriptional regulator [Levilactobacillus humaensis]